jgi:hypothetical protein
MRQPASPSVRPPRRPIRQRPSARVVKLYDQAKPVNGPRKWGSGVEEQEQVEMFQRWRRSRGGKTKGGGLDLASAGCHHRRGRAAGGSTVEVAAKERGVGLGLP